MMGSASSLGGIKRRIQVLLGMSLATLFILMITGILGNILLTLGGLVLLYHAATGGSGLHTMLGVLALLMVLSDVFGGFETLGGGRR